MRKIIVLILNSSINILSSFTNSENSDLLTKEPILISHQS